MRNLVREAVLVSRELGDITFVGAVAVYLHTRRTRESLDIDFAVATGMSREETIRKGGYATRMESGKEVTRTPRGIKVDIYDNDVSDIPIETIGKTAMKIPVNNKGTTLKVMCLEALIIAKHRAKRPARPQDDQDLLELARTKYDQINWDLLRSMATKSEVEFETIRVTMNAFRDL